MKNLFLFVSLFFFVFIIYLAVSTQYTFKPKWTHDHFNPLAKSLLQMRLDISNPQDQYDLIEFNGKWYAPWGVLSAIFFIPVQLIKGRFIPSIYITIFFASLNVVVVYLLLQRIGREFLPSLTKKNIFLFLAFFTFGTTHFYVGTLGSSWHVDQMTTTFFATLGTFIIFKKKRRLRDYFFSMFMFSLTLIGRPTFVFYFLIPWFLYLWDNIISLKSSGSKKMFNFVKAIFIFGLPLGFFSVLFFLYNYLRFDSLFEYGYTHIHESPYLAVIRESTGVISLSYIPYNLWYMLFEVPTLNYINGKFSLGINLLGNSIIILSMPIITAFLAVPIRKVKNKFTIDPYLFSLWITTVVVMLPSLMIYSTGWMQFGYRYSLDIMLLLLILSIFGVKGKMHPFYMVGIFISIFLHILGIQALM